MTIIEFVGETKEWAKEHWWNGGGVVVVAFLVVTFIWKRPANDFLLYAALIVLGAHAYVSTVCFGKHRQQARHHAEIAVAYRAHLKAVQNSPSGQENPDGQNRPPARRDRSPARPVPGSAVFGGSPITR